MKKRYAAVFLAVAMTMGSAMTSFAGWQSDANGWWWQNEDGSYPSNTWQWIDGNGDGVAECYYFDGNGYMLANTTTPDGYQVNVDGAWVVNGAVQTQNNRNGTQTVTNTSAPTSEEIVDYLVNDKLDSTLNNPSMYFKVDYNKATSTNGSTNIKYWTGIQNGWVWHPYYGYSSTGVYLCALAFDENGYLLVNTTTPDGYYVNEYGMLEINGIPVVHTSECGVLPWSSTIYDNNGNVIIDKNNSPLNNMNVTQNMMNIMNYSGNTIPYGNLVYNHCSYRDSDGWFQESYGFENCVNADKILHPQASDENHY